MLLTRNKAQINFRWSLCEVFPMALCLCLREHLLHFCWPLCPFHYEHIALIEMITAFQSMVKTTGRTFSKPQWPLKHLTTVTREINLGQLSIWVQTQRLSEIKLNDARGQFLVTSLLVGHLHLCGLPFTKCIDMMQQAADRSPFLLCCMKLNDFQL